MTIPTEIAIATFLAGLAGCVAVGIGMVPLTADAGGGWPRSGVGPFGTSGKKGWSGFAIAELSGGGGGGCESVAGGGAEATGYNGWWRILRWMLES